MAGNSPEVEMLLKYKELLDSGVITQEEFDKKKSEILSGEITIKYENSQSNAETKTNEQKGSSSGISTKATAILGYFGILLWAIAFFAGDKEGAKFHLNQSLVIDLFCFLCAIPVLGWIWAVFMLVVWIMGLIAAINGEEKEVPLLGKIKIIS